MTGTRQRQSENDRLVYSFISMPHGFCWLAKDESEPLLKSLGLSLAASPAAKASAR